MALTCGTKLGPYEIVAPLGAGGTGEVYRARDTKLGRKAALKLLPPLAQERSHQAGRCQLFNHQRPHEALGMKCPAEVYQPLSRQGHGRDPVRPHLYGPQKD